MRCGKGAPEEGAGRGGIASIAQVHVDDLAVFVNGSEQIPPAPADLEQGLIDPPFGTDPLSMLLRRLWSPPD